MMYDFPPQSGCNVTLPGPSLQSLCSAAEYIVFMTALDKAIRNNSKISGNCERIKPINEPAEEYDFIVVGGGAGGAAVAGRLAEISKWKILVLEAGKDESAAGQIPSFAGSMLGSEIDWKYYTTNESYACLSNNGSCYWASAKCLGGNTAINQMICLRGNRVDFDNWAAQGNYGWTWDEVLKYYKKQEDNANIDEVGYEYHGTGGPLPIGRFPFVPEAKEDFMKAAEESGFGVTKDVNGKNPTGLTVVQSTQKNGVRVSSASAYLRPHRHRKNLDISLNSHVTRIIMENKTAVGVEYIKNGKLRRVRAKREVIISAGTVKSPQLLLLSGIGPKEHLKAKGIEPVMDSHGVGSGLQDHVGFTLSFTINGADTFENNVAVANEYLQYQTGPMSTGSQFAFFGLGRSSMTTPDSPDFMISIHAFTAGCATGKINALRSNGRRKVSIWVENYHPESRGRVSLASNDPLEDPVLWANYLSNPKDLEVLLEGIEAALKLTKTKALQAYNFTLAVEPSEECSCYTIPSREYWACAVQQNTQAGWHQAGSCKMGPASDPMAVVDPELRVHGIKNLRVVDASIMPQVTSGNTATPTMMIGERGADFIKKTWLPSHSEAGSPSSWNKESPHCGRFHPAAVSTRMTYDFPSQGGGCNVTLPGPSLQTLCSAAEYVYFMTALDTAIRNNPTISGSCERVKPIDEPLDEYDFIVAGGGTAGSVVAARLAENSDWKILVLEAGEDESAAGQVPIFTLSLLGSVIDWNYRTSNERYAFLSRNGSAYWSSAKCLGGNSAHNEMLYIRGNPTDYNNWAAQGNNGWNWEKVLKFYKKQEDNANIDEVGRKYHGTGGPLPVGFFPYQSKFTKAFMTAAKQSGFGVTKDSNGKDLTGLSVCQSTQKNGVRFSSSRAYLWLHRDSKNLDISLKSHVTKIIMKNKTAVGVEYIKNGKLRSVRAKREVIISTGVVRSPQLLLLSGIGPKDHLKSKGIKVVSNLPGVGENLHDQPAFGLTFTINQTDTYFNDVLITNQYLQNQTGLLSTVAEPYFVGAGCTNKTFPEYPDLQIYFLTFGNGCAPGAIGAIRSYERRQISAYIVNVHPKSRGRVSLASKNPLDQPTLWGNYLSEPSDLEVILDGIEIVLKFAETKALKKYDFTLATKPLKACSNYIFRTRDYWACAVRQETVTLWHPVGSCKMGPTSDPMAVVDPKLRVHKTKNLRIVDAAAMPQVTSGNTAAPTMMIGERGAEFIKKKWLPKRG